VEVSDGSLEGGGTPAKHGDLPELSAEEQIAAFAAEMDKHPEWMIPEDDGEPEDDPEPGPDPEPSIPWDEREPELEDDGYEPPDDDDPDDPAEADSADEGVSDAPDWF
jgi:hypothetical protein